jgi:hypothetical protein
MNLKNFGSWWQLLENSGLSVLEVSEADTKIRLEKGTIAERPVAPVVMQPAAVRRLFNPYRTERWILQYYGNQIPHGRRVLRRPPRPTRSHT